MNRLIFAMALVFVACFPAFGQHYKVLYSFGGYLDDAARPIGGLAFDREGNLYGTTEGGGAGIGSLCADTGCGTVFELAQDGQGGWTESVLHSFCSVYNGLCLDGAGSYAALVSDSAGNLYGTTIAGGSMNGCPFAGGDGCGTAFELSPPGSPGGAWTETVLYNFCSVGGNNSACLDGLFPGSRLTFDGSGNLYGTSQGGSGHYPPQGLGGGIVFKLSPGSPAWKQTVLYNFCSLGQGEVCPDGEAPNSNGVSFGTSGKLYSATEYGGDAKNGGGGIVYELSPGSAGWSQTVLAVFPTHNQIYGLPASGVTVDPMGNLYGSFQFPKGGVFRLNPTTKKKSVFLFNGADGDQPIGGVTLDLKHGVLYGTTSSASGGTENIYKIDAAGKETVLYNFCSQPHCADGDLPQGTLIQDQAGNLYGTTTYGGLSNQGVVFEYTP